MALIGERLSSTATPTLLLALIPSAAVLFGGMNSVFGNPVLCIGFAGLLTWLLLSRAPSLRFWQRARTPLALIAAAFLWAMLVSWQPAAGLIGARPVAPDLAGPALVGFAACVAALLCGAVIGARRVPLAGVIDWMLLLGCVGLVAALAWQDMGTAPPWTQGRDGRFFGTLENANAAAAVYGALASLALARLIVESGQLWDDRAPLVLRLRAAGYVVLLLLLIGGCLLTASRAGSLLMLAGLLLVAAWASGRRGRLSVVVGCGLLIIAGLFGIGDLLVDRTDALGGDFADRLTLWQHNGAVAGGSLLFGHGLGGFPAVNMRFLDDPRIAQAIWTTNSPHDIVLRLVIDGGLPFAALIGAAALALLSRIAGCAARRGLDLHEVALLAALGVIFGLALVDIALEVPAIAAMAMVWTGLLWGRALGGHAEVGVAAAHDDPLGGERAVPG